MIFVEVSFAFAATLDSGADSTEESEIIQVDIWRLCWLREYFDVWSKLGTDLVQEIRCWLFSTLFFLEV